jgi:two-component system sensor histidine kinase ChiS
MESKPLIMVVDDEEEIRRLLCRVLELEGHRVASAGDADSALALLQQEEPALIILDIMMPGRSGAQVLPETRTSHPDTPVIMDIAVLLLEESKGFSIAASESAPSDQPQSRQDSLERYVMSR